MLKVHQQSKLKVYVDEIKIHRWERTMKCCQQCQKQQASSKKELNKIKLKSGGKAGKGKLVGSNKLLDSKVSSYDSGGSGLSDHVEYFGIDVRNQTRRLGRRKQEEGRSTYI